jgi:hypothetical protein
VGTNDVFVLDKVIVTFARRFTAWMRSAPALWGGKGFRTAKVSSVSEVIRMHLFTFLALISIWFVLGV